MIEGILGGLVSEVARILEVCKQPQKPAQHQIHQLYGFLKRIKGWKPQPSILSLTRSS